jgi:hypothetical protein
MVTNAAAGPFSTANLSTQIWLSSNSSAKPGGSADLIVVPYVFVANERTYVVAAENRALMVDELRVYDVPDENRTFLT